jgi:hypothetical protein
MKIKVINIMAANIDGETFTARSTPLIEIVEDIEDALLLGDTVKLTVLSGNKLKRIHLTGTPAGEIEWL